MKFTRRELPTIGALSLALWGAAGCTSGRLSRPDAASLPALRAAPRALLTGPAYDRALIAARNRDKDAFNVACDELQRLGLAAKAVMLAGSIEMDAAESAVVRGTLYDTQARGVQSAAKAELQIRAAEEYRKALRLSPRFDSRDPQKLNSLGYFLADRGNDAADYQTAERLTRRAVALWDAAIAGMKANEARTLDFRFSRANTRDSLAWALYRLKQYPAALREQQNAVAEAQAISATFGAQFGPIPAELHFHLGKIHAASGQTKAAIEQYRAALRVDPNDAQSRRALQELTGEAPPSRPQRKPRIEPSGPLAVPV